MSPSYMQLLLTHTSCPYSVIIPVSQYYVCNTLHVLRTCCWGRNTHARVHTICHESTLLYCRTLICTTIQRSYLELLLKACGLI